LSRIIKAAQVETVAQPQPEPRPEDLGASASLSDYLVDAARVLEVAEAQASRLMERARARAVELVEEVERRASERLEAARREAEEAGYQEGLRRGREEGLQQAQAVVDRLERLAEQLVRLREDLLRLHEEDVVKLALAVAEKVIGRVKEEDHELAVRTVRHLLNQVSGAREIRIRVHPDDLPQVEAHQETWKRLFEGTRTLAIVGDDRIAPGDALVETEFGAIDSGIESRFREVGEALMEVLRGEA